MEKLSVDGVKELARNLDLFEEVDFDKIPVTLQREFIKKEIEYNNAAKEFADVVRRIIVIDRMV